MNFPENRIVIRSDGRMQNDSEAPVRKDRAKKQITGIK